VRKLIFVSHPEVVVEPRVDVRRWRLGDDGIRRMRHFADTPVVASVTEIWSSTEAKAIEAAGILAAGLGCGVGVEADLGENDRSATGFLPPNEFESMADSFFAEPHRSVRGWERAVDAQSRIRNAIARLVSRGQAGDVAVVSHGAVGSLLYCALAGRPISRDADQPFQGHYWTATLPALSPLHGWRSIAPRGQADGRSGPAPAPPQP
jgi:broad specificity phosphatase PhoE